MKITEQSSNYSNLDKMSVRELLEGMNNEDKNVPYAIEKCIPQIEIVERMKRGGDCFIWEPALVAVLVFWMLLRYLLHTELHLI